MKETLRCFNVLVYPLVFCLILLGVPHPGFAQENIVIETYYPSPMGIYDQLTINKFLNFRAGGQMRAVADLGQPAVPMITFYPNQIVFEAPATFAGDLTLEGDVDIDGQLRFYGNLLRVNGPMQVGFIQFCTGGIFGVNITALGYAAGAVVRDSRYNIGASLRERYSSDNGLLTDIAMTQTILAGGFLNAAIICGGTVDPWAGIAFGVLAALDGLMGIFSWADRPLDNVPY